VSDGSGQPVKISGKHRAGVGPDRNEQHALFDANTSMHDVPPPAIEDWVVDEGAKPDVVMQYKVLFVCTGNIHRSVMGERLMRSRVRLSLPIAIRSAGTQAVVDHPIGEFSAIALEQLGADSTHHKARQLMPAIAASADLILTAEMKHRQLIFIDTPSALRRVFSLHEFARLAEKVEPLKPSDPCDIEALKAQVFQVSAQRGVARRATRSEDIADPVRASLKETHERAREIAECVDTVIDTLGLGAL
jgi:protein-tyrosine phosphatase